MTTVKNIAILVQLSRPYDREVLAGIAQFVQSRPNWRVYVGDGTWEAIEVEGMASVD